MTIRMLTCPNCAGKGYYKGTRADTWNEDYFTCKNCDGVGEVVHPQDRVPPPPVKKRRWFW